MITPHPLPFSGDVIHTNPDVLTPGEIGLESGELCLSVNRREVAAVRHTEVLGVLPSQVGVVESVANAAFVLYCLVW